MKECPHCAQPVGELAVVCPSCKSVIDPSHEVARKLVAAENARSNPPDPGLFILSGAAVAVIGLVVVLASDDGSGGVAVGWVVMAVGLLVLLVGVVAYGVYIGLRQFDQWQRAAEESGQP